MRNDGPATDDFIIEGISIGRWEGRRAERDGNDKAEPAFARTRRQARLEVGRPRSLERLELLRSSGNRFLGLRSRFLDLDTRGVRGGLNPRGAVGAGVVFVVTIADAVRDMTTRQ